MADEKYIMVLGRNSLNQSLTGIFGNIIPKPMINDITKDIAIEVDSAIMHGITEIPAFDLHAEIKEGILANFGTDTLNSVIRDASMARNIEIKESLELILNLKLRGLIDVNNGNQYVYKRGNDGPDNVG